MKGEMNRRDFIRTGLVASALLPVAGAVLHAPVARAADEDKLVTDIPANAPVIGALKYVNESEKPDQNCANCQFFTPSGEDRGKCQLLPQGLVTSKGWCASWTQKVT